MCFMIKCINENNFIPGSDPQSYNVNWYPTTAVLVADCVNLSSFLWKARNIKQSGLET